MFSDKPEQIVDLEGIQKSANEKYKIVKELENKVETMNKYKIYKKYIMILQNIYNIYKHIQQTYIINI